MNTTIKSLYDNYRQDVYVYLIGLTRNQTLAEDLTSEVFVSAIKSLPNFQGKSEIKTWLFAIARHKWYEALRRKKKNISISERLQFYLQDESPSAEDTLVNTAVLSRITELLEMEKPRNKAVILLRLDGYSFYEIGQKCDISESSARVIDFRVRKKLREILTKEGFANE